MSTPHINGNKGDFAETVIFPGDPLRAKYIAKNFLSNMKEVTRIRNVLGYTGNYKNKQISVMASGMGIPSSSIYAIELITKFDVKNLIRVGTAGALPNSNLKLNDIVIAIGASTDSSINRIRFNNFDLAATCSFKILQNVYITAKESNIDVTIGDCFTSDSFYLSDINRYNVLNKMGILCVDMETAGIYGLSKEYKASAISILTISDIIGNNIATKELTPQERETSLDKMINLALDSAIKL